MVNILIKFLERKNKTNKRKKIFNEIIKKKFQELKRYTSLYNAKLHKMLSKVNFKHNHVVIQNASL